MSIQPGNGYNFVSSSQGISLDINQPYTSSPSDSFLFGVSFPAFPPFPPFPDINGPQFPEFGEAFHQFKVETLVVGSQQYIRIACGAVNFTQSNMPLIYKAPVTDTRQVWISKVAVRPGISATDGGNPDSEWMENGGYYSLPSSGEYYVTICKMDFDGAETPSALLQKNTPFVAIFKYDNPLYNKIFSETGPSQYVNKNNVQKMTGYDATSTGFTGDFANCHSTYFNPVKIGYSVKVIAIINTEVPVITEPQIEVLHAATATSNEVHRITLPPDMKKSGSFKLHYDAGFTTDTTDPFDPFNPLNSGNLSGQFQWNLANALKKIQELRGNSNVTVSGKDTLDVTYVNNLANTAVPLPSIIENSVEVPTTTYAVWQQVIGSIDLSIPIQFTGSTLMNLEGLNEEDDPYYVNQADDWSGICNITLRDQMQSITAATTDYYYDIVGPADWTSHQHSFLEVDGCTDEGQCAHPFRVRKIVTGETVTYKVCPGMVNNISPSNNDTPISIGGGYIYIVATVSGENYPVTVTLGTAGAVPADTETESYIAIARIVSGNAEQLVSSSLWTERFKCGGNDTRYWWSNV
jgi:hypothetical protein